jgi:hypothetical protein
MRSSVSGMPDVPPVSTKIPPSFVLISQVSPT